MLARARRAPRRPTAASRPGCRRAGAGRARSRGPGRWPSAQLSRACGSGGSFTASGRVDGAAPRGAADVETLRPPRRPVTVPPGRDGQRAVRRRRPLMVSVVVAGPRRDEAGDRHAGDELDAPQAAAARGRPSRGRRAGRRPWRPTASPRPAAISSPMNCRRTSRTVADTAATVLSALVRPRTPAQPRRRDRASGGIVWRRGGALRDRRAGEEGGERVLRAVGPAEVAADDRVAGERHGDELRAGDPRRDARRVLERRAQVGAARQDQRRHRRQRRRAPPGPGSRWASRRTAGSPRCAARPCGRTARSR